ncbi:hypothetical protein L3Q82_007082 [Scortum barcoo]|uniref:Uncharacterized protein n=1 Tax=Scortum barcoo TaxID=214431 RepID=A0ACB8WR95_9TELE|nr:hypothetical protein L3Q82_007082 [Scortum barcoo]
MESPVGALSSTPPRDSKKAGCSVLLFRPVGTNNCKRPIPNLKAQGSDPLVHRGELQHMAAELGSYKQAHTSSPLLTLGNSRVVEGPAPLKKELGSRAQAMRGGEPELSLVGTSQPPLHELRLLPPQRGDIPCPYCQSFGPGIGSSRPPPRLLPKPHCTGPSWTFLLVLYITAFAGYGAFPLAPTQLCST